MRALGYPERVSIEAFRYPDFILTSDILIWLVQRYDSDASLPTAIETESDRLLFLSAVVSFVRKSARISLRPAKLLAADGYAVQELLKLASVLYKASRMVARAGGDAVAGIVLPPLPTNLAESVSKTRGLASELTELSAQLYDLLEAEEELRNTRAAAIEQNLDMDALARSIRAAAGAAKAKQEAVAERFKAIAADEEHLRKKISKKQDELDRKGQRLSDLKDSRPAYMDEYEALENELRHKYELYLERTRNLSYLERELDSYQLKEAAQFDEAAKSLAQLRSKIQKENDHRLLGDDDDSDDDMLGGGSDSDDNLRTRGSGNAAYSAARARNKAASSAASTFSSPPAKVRGSLNASSSSSSSSSDGGASDDSDF